MAEEEGMELVQAVEEIEDDEVREYLKKPEELRRIVAQTKSALVDHTALQTARMLMSSPDTPEGVKRDMVVEWLKHRRAERELTHKIQSGQPDGINFNFTFGTNAEVDNIRQVKSAFGVDDAEDVEGTYDE